MESAVAERARAEEALAAEGAQRQKEAGEAELVAQVGASIHSQRDSLIVLCYR